ncbi:type II toxin-antitoxin system HicB family antitoxin [Microbispora sp. RL4-1S]|uniref:Type II toxin-antitoxin system HicB family antitoxin n=1 Tax=Microbispora oryzae TaxID=2806554 RepID=A0A940WLA8_9ACTN|nr:type II toxin-antitoxin system HicB family antitoxin [Microbispora oryzae]MBP2705977.1 type II toxin-antitoxin system HicB family antitoxin [Microbispora oryzae]
MESHCASSAGELLHAVERGRSVTVRAGDRTMAVVDGERLRDFLARFCPAEARVVAEDGRWSVFIPGLPVAADGSTYDEAIDEMGNALREYAEDWQEHLADTANHRGNWALVQMICLSSEDQLREWLTIHRPVPEAGQQYATRDRG